MFLSSSFLFWLGVLTPSAQALKRMEAEENGRKERGETCNLCGYSAKTFEPMTYYCNGAQCNGKRIGRGRYFYHASGSNQWHWCSVSPVLVCFGWYCRSIGRFAGAMVD